MDKAQKSRNGFILRLLIVGFAIWGVFRVAYYFFGPQTSATAVEMSDFADKRIDHFYSESDGGPARGMVPPPPPALRAPAN